MAQWGTVSSQATLIVGLFVMECSIKYVFIHKIAMDPSSAQTAKLPASSPRSVPIGPGVASSGPAPMPYGRYVGWVLAPLSDPH